MINCHQTPICPWCNKDSYADMRSAYFGTAKCTWCDCEFKAENKCMVVVKPGAGKKKE